MNAIQLENEKKLLERHPQFFEHINVAIVTDGFHHTVGIYSVVQLQKDWVQLGSRKFKEVYGFNLHCTSKLHKGERN